MKSKTDIYSEARRRVRERELPADGIELRHKAKVERIDRTTFRDWPKIMEQTAKLIKQREGEK